MHHNPNVGEWYRAHTQHQPKNATPYRQAYSRDVDNNGGIGMQYHR